MRYAKKSIEILLWIAITLKLVVLLDYAIKHDSNFDAAFHLQAATSWLTNGYPQLTYPEPTPFAQSIQIGWPFLIPIGIGSLLLPGFLGVNLIAFIFLLLLLFLIYKLSGQYCENLTPLLAISFVLLIPKLDYYALTGFGEIPALVYFLLSILIISKGFRYIFIAGIFLGLSIATKSVFALSIVAVFAWIILDPRSIKLHKPILLIAGLALPLVLSEFHKFLIIGYEDYVSYWQTQFSSIASKGGVDSSTAFFDRISIKFSALEKHGVPVFVAILLISFALIAFIKSVVECLRKKNPLPAHIHLLLIFALGYATWWLLFPPQGFFRRFLNPTILLSATFIPSFFYVTSNYIFNSESRRLFMGRLIAIPLVIALIPFHSLATLDFKRTENELATYIQENVSEEALIGVWDWWQAPRISWLTGRTFIDLSQVQIDQDIEYVIIGSLQQTLNPYSVKSVRRWTGELVFVAKNGDQLYRADHKDSHFTKARKMEKIEISNLDTQLLWPTDSEFRSEQLEVGFYNEKNYAWIGSIAAAFLANDRGADSVTVQGRVPHHLTSTSPVNLRVYINGLRNSEFFLSDGAFEVTIAKTLEQQSADYLYIELLVDKSFVPRNLGINNDMRRLALLITAIRQ